MEKKEIVKEEKQTWINSLKSKLPKISLPSFSKVIETEKVAIKTFIIWIIGITWVYYKTHDNSHNYQQQSSNIEKPSINKETDKNYTKDSILSALLQITDTKLNLKNIDFTQDELENILLIYSKTKTSLWEHTSEKIHNILKNMILTQLSKWYVIKWYIELQQLKNNLEIFSKGKITFEYSTKNPEFLDEIIIIWKLNSDNKLSISKASWFDSIDIFFSSNQKNFNYTNIMSVFEAMRKDMPKWYSILNNKLTQTNSKLQETEAQLYLSNSNILTKEWIIENLNSEIKKIIEENNRKEQKKELEYQKHNISTSLENQKSIKKLSETHQNEKNELNTIINNSKKDVSSLEKTILNISKNNEEDSNILIERIEELYKWKSDLEITINKKDLELNELNLILKSKNSEIEKLNNKNKQNDRNNKIEKNNFNTKKLELEAENTELKNKVLSKNLDLKDYSNQLISKENEINELKESELYKKYRIERLERQRLEKIIEKAKKL